MDNDFELLRRRYERERLARKQSEQIAEEESREIFLKSQELARATIAEHAAKQEAELLLRSLRSFSAELRTVDILELFSQFLNEILTNDRITVFLKSGDLFQLTNSYGTERDDQIDDRQSILQRFQRLQDVNCPSIINNATADNWAATLGVHQNTVSMLIISLATQGRTFGYTLLESQTNDVYHEANANLAQALADEAAITLETARLFQEVERLSTIDPLTGMFNRSYFETAAEREISLALRNQQPLAMLMLDIDHFKKVNDTYGHSIGDKVLTEVANACLENLRKTDINVRFGGEEFAVLCPNTNTDGAVNLAERIRNAVSTLTFYAGENSFRVTVSIGITLINQGGDTLINLAKHADEALYSAKSQGRNRTVVCTLPQ